MRKALVAVMMSVAMIGWGGSRVMAVCGDKVVDPGEDCDLGGTCIGGANAGTTCTSDGMCPNGKCKTFGGNGCAANCTSEHDVPYVLVQGSLMICQDGPNAGKPCSKDDDCPGSTCVTGCQGGPNAGKPCSTDADCPGSTCLTGFNLVPGTSGVALNTSFLPPPSQLAVPLGGSCNGGDNANMVCVTNADCPGGACVQAQQMLTVGKKGVDGTIPVVVRAASVKFPGVEVLSLVCGCIHGVAAKTCGGTFLEADNTTLSTNCTPGFTKCTTAACNTAGEPCEGKDPCAFVHGDGNTASGVIGCNGLDGTDILYEQDSGGSSKVEGPSLITLSGHGPAGSAVFTQSLSITGTLGPCVGSDPGTYGPDGVFCTADDPPATVMAMGTLPAVTGNATGVVHNANGMDGEDLGPVTVSGAPFSCTALEQSTNPSTGGGGIVGAFSAVHLNTVGDIAVTAQLFAAGAKPACTGDCNSDGDAKINELITLVNIAHGTAGATCPGGVPSGSTTVDIGLIMQAINHAQSGCSQA